ncbi:hypothetical protein [Phenylobacterium aquaticum]|uniref:hypothetical protein n=1 Tax=Phenylobacterium aquaticum TaxID=1763816 RepID=UPI0026F0262E|nr:hypothetical protein [Phenylobacterium aquaticum]
MQDLSLPPSITVGPTSLGVSVLTEHGVTVQVSLPRPRGLHDLPASEVAARALRLAYVALMDAARTMPGESLVVTD